MISKTEPHRHDYRKLGFVEDRGRAEHTNEIIREVLSRDIRRIILTRVCECGQSQAFECGPKQEMRELYTKIKNMEGIHDAGFV